MNPPLIVSAVFPPPDDILIEESKGHGRYERREYRASTHLPLEVMKKWPGTATIVQITRTRSGKKIKSSTEIVYAMTDRRLREIGLNGIATDCRGHWGIENKLHHVKDVTFLEDKCRIHVGNGAQAFSCLRNLILNLFRIRKVKNVAKEMRRMANHPGSYKEYLNSYGEH